MKILIAEDCEADIYLIGEALIAAGLQFEAEIASSGEKALDLIDRAAAEPLKRPDAMILDLNLTTHGGIDILRHVRSVPALAQMPVAIFTSSESPVDRELARKLGANAYLHKSMDLEIFMQAGREIAQLFSNHQHV